MIRILLAGTALPCLSLAPAAVAQSRDIIVTTTRSPQPLADVPASVSVVTAHDIAATPARTLDDVLRRLPSVDLPLTGAGEQHPTNTIVSMRGLSGIRSLVLLDGVPLNDPFFGYVQWSEVPLATVDRVEVVRGGGATLWGNYAMGGVVNILTRPVDRTALVAQVSGGSRGTVRADTHAALAGQGWGVALDAGVNHTDGYLEQVESARGAISVPSAFTATTLAASGNAELTPNLTARARASWFDNGATFLTRLNTNRQRTLRLTAALAWRPDDRTSVELSAFGNDERFRTDNPGTPAGAEASEAEYVQNRHLTRANDAGVSLVARREFAGVLRSLSLGADYHGVSGRDDARIFDEGGAFLRTDTGSGRQRFLGAWGQADLRPTDRLQLLVSLRYQDFASFDGVDGAPGGQGRVPSRHDSDVDPRVSLRYQLRGGVALRGAWYRAFRAPTLDNLYRAASVPGYILYGNPALAPETLDGGELGFDVDRGPVRLQVTAYTSTIDGFLTYRYLPPDQLPAGFDVGARLINAGSARSRGVEAELTWRLRPALAATLAYTYADSVVTRNPEDPASVGVQQPGIPRHRVSAGLDWTGPRGLRLSPRLRYVSRTNGDPDALFRTDAHVIADLAATLPLTGKVEVFGEVENLFDRRYVATNDGFTAPLYGRPFTATAGLRVTL